MIATPYEPLVEICMATYKGARFLPDQLDSLARQTYANWRLLVRDDCSEDNTRAMLEAFAAQHPDKVKLLESHERLGVIANFSAVLTESRAPYVFLCDQDDVWRPDKVATMLAEMRRLEERHGQGHPLLLHSDLVVVDGSLNTIHRSFWKYARLSPKKVKTLARLLPQNCVTGCAALCNRALLLRALPIAPQALMHDWWLALVAAAFGSVEVWPEATLYYRQHGNNTLGAKRTKFPYSLLRLLLDRGHINAKKRLQAQSLLDRYGDKLSEEQRCLVREYLSLPEKGRLSRALAIWRYGYTKQGFLRQLAFLLGVYN